MDIQRIAEQVGELAQKQAVQEAEREKQEVVEMMTKVVTAQYNSAKAYTNVVIFAGYAAFFAMWGFARADIPRSASLWALFLMTLSAAAFVLFEVYKMIWSSWSVRRQIFALEDSDDPLGRMQKLDRALQREVHVFGKVWLFTLIASVPPGLAALVVVAVNMLEILVLEP